MKKGVVSFFIIFLTISVLFISCRGGQSGVEMIINNGMNIHSLDPTQIIGVPEHRVNKALFEGLVTYDQYANIVPGVAESWSFNEDSSVVTFKIRQGIVWSDGTPITAGQIRESWLHHLNPDTASQYAYMQGNAVKGAAEYNEGKGSAEDVGIRAIDDRTFEVTLLGTIPFVLDLMAHYSFNPLPMHVIKEYGSAWTRPEHFVGNGPFVLSEYIPNNKVTVVPNTKYWNKENVYLKKITFLPIDDQNTAYQAFLNGEIDWITDVPLPRIDEVKLHKDYHVSAQAGVYYLIINTKIHPALADPRVRRSLSMGFDREELLNNVLKGGQIPALSFVPPMGDYEPTTGNGFNVAEAKRLLAEAGYPDGRGLPTFEYIYNTADSNRIIGEYIQEAWKKNIGVNINLQNMEWGAFLEYRSTPQFQISRAGWTADFVDPQTFLNLLITDSGNNNGKYSDTEFDRLAQRTSAMVNSPERTRLMRQAEDIAITRDQAVIPIYYFVSQNMIDLDVWEGWSVNPLNLHTYVGLKRK